jgi:hypothetical protein
MIVLDHDFVGRVMGVISAADEREYVAAEQHLDDADTPSPAPASTPPSTARSRRKISRKGSQL